MIEIDGLTFKYVGRRLPTLQNISLCVARGESVLLLGPSGCGKSTLALALNGAIPHAVSGDLRGTVHVAGLETRRASMAELAQRAGIVFQDPEAQFCMLSVEDEVAFGLENLAVPRSEMDPRIDAALARVGLGDRREEQVSRLSGGQKQRLALACVLALEPDVIVLDEPTAQLDPAGAADVVAVLRKLRAEGRHTLVIVEHRLDDVAPLVDRAVVFSADGEIVANGPPREVIQGHGAHLAAAGVWTPQVSELALKLADGGLTLDPFPISLPEAETALRPHVGVLQSLVEAGDPAPQPLHHPRERGLPHRPRGCGPEPELAGLQPRSERIPQGSPVPEANGGPLLTVSGLSYQYPRRSHPVLSDVNLTISAGELVAIVGANGAGKSTLARLVAGILRPPAGAIMVRGRDAATLSHKEQARKIGYVFQYPEHQFVGQTVLDDVAYGPRRAGVPDTEALELGRAMLADFGLQALAAAHPFTLSHGEQRRLSVASMLVLGQELLLLDEPTFGQDQRNATMLLDKLEALAQDGRAIVAITHDMRLVSERAARVLVVGDGTILFDGPPAGLFADARLLARAHLLPPPLWEVSRRLGLRGPLPRLDRLNLDGGLLATSPTSAASVGPSA